MHAQIQALYELEPEVRTLSSLHGLLPATLRGPLGAWIQGGAWGSIFDNAEDSLTLADWQAVDMAGAAGKPELARALLYYLLHRLGTVITVPEELGRWKLLVVDEAWRFLADPQIGAYLGEGLKTWRKSNAGVVLATQSPGDATGNAGLCRTMAESCLTKIFLANPELDPSGYAEAFGLRTAEAEAIRALVPKRQLLLHRPGFAQVLELSVDRRSYWVKTLKDHPQEIYLASRDAQGISDYLMEHGRMLEQDRGESVQDRQNGEPNMRQTNVGSDRSVDREQSGVEYPRFRQLRLPWPDRARSIGPAR